MQCASGSENGSVVNSKKSGYILNGEDSVSFNRSLDESVIENRIQQIKTQHQL